MRGALFYGWIIVAVTAILREHVGDYTAAFVAAGWIAIVAGLTFAALAVRRRPITPDATASPVAL